MNKRTAMNEEVRAYLDGERTLESLSDGARAEAEMWDRTLADLRTPVGPAPDWIEDSVMAEIAGAPTQPTLAPTASTETVSWWRRPVQIRVTPLHGLLTAAVVAGLIFIPRGGPGAAPPTDTIYVQFVLEAPGATSVAVAGDFSEWEGVHTLDDPDGDGIWTGRVPMDPGVHQYMFVVDGADWVTDPQAERYADDGFGNRNAVIAVGPVPQVNS